MGPTAEGGSPVRVHQHQWPQARLFQAKQVDSPNCRLCVELGYCDPMDPSPAHKGTLVHRMLTCPATRAYREMHAPKWIIDLAVQLMRTKGCTPSKERDLLTRALAQSPAFRVEKASPQASFEWVVPPSGDSSACVRGKLGPSAW